MCAAPAGPEAERQRRRATALWLAELATTRVDALKVVRREFGSVEQALARSPVEITAAFAPKRALRLEDGRFRTVLAAGPPGSPDLLRHPPEAVHGRTHCVTLLDDDYPPRLHHLVEPPPALFVRGRVAEGLAALRRQVVVAVVGSRSPSPYGREMASSLARDLTEAGALVVSGMALGIDATAQRAALQTSAACATVGVLGCGADREHPPGNRDLFAQACRRGLLVSEFAWGATPAPWRFPRRNRLLAALADAVVIVEGGERSGARITAGLAIELGREVLAVPGEAGRKLSACPHRLIREGAAMCESAADVFEALHLAPGPNHAAVLDKWSPGEGLAGRVLALLAAGPRGPDHLALELHAPVGAVLAALTTLELAGEVCADGDWYRRRQDRRR